jgi:hypothetical protein
MSAAGRDNYCGGSGGSDHIDQKSKKGLRALLFCRENYKPCIEKNMLQ